MNNRTRHIAIRERYVTEKAAIGDISITWVPTDKQVADVFTKPLPREIGMKHLRLLGLEIDVNICQLCFSGFKSGNALHAHLRAEHITQTRGR